MRNLIGIYLFSMYWYWYPLANFMGLALEPTYLVGVTSNLKIPRSFQFMSKAPKNYFAYQKTQIQETVEEQKQLVQLSVPFKV